MKRNLFRNLFSIFFLLIFFFKMMICAAPLLVKHMDSQAVNAVIMQLEIEDNTEKSSDKVKELPIKEYFNLNYEFSFSNPLMHLSATPYNWEDEKHVRIFYPKVPTPPPSV